MTTNAPLGEGNYINTNNNSNWENEEVWEVPMEHFNSPRKGEYVTAKQEYENMLTFENPKLLQTPKKPKGTITRMPSTPQKKYKYNISSPKKNTAKVRRTEPSAPIKKKFKSNRKSRKASRK